MNIERLMTADFMLCLIVLIQLTAGLPLFARPCRAEYRRQVGFAHSQSWEQVSAGRWSIY